MHGVFSAKQMQETLIGQVTAKTTAGFWPVMIDFATILTVDMLQKHAALIVRVYHIDLAAGLCLCRGDIQALFPYCCHAEVDTNMTTHSRDEFYFIGLQANLPILLATCSTLPTIMENCAESMFVDSLVRHFNSLL